VNNATTDTTGTADIIETFRNAELGLAARIVFSRVKPGTYAVVLRDEQAGETVGARHGILDYDNAVSYAKTLIE